MIASLCRRGHHAFLLKKTGINEGRHFKRDEVHLEGTGSPSDDAVLQVRQIEFFSGKGDVAAYLTEQIAGETFRSVLGGSGLAMNRSVSGIVRDTEGFVNHASGVLVIHDPLSLLQRGKVGINKRQSERVLIETKTNLSPIAEDCLLKCTTERASGYSFRVSTPVPFAISTELPPTNNSVVTITRSNEQMIRLVRTSALSIDAIGNGKKVISASTRFPHNIFVVPYKSKLGLHHNVGDTPNQTIYEALVERDAFGSVPVLLSTSKHDNEGLIVITNGIAEAIHNIIRLNSVKDPKSPLYISEANLLKSGPLKVVDNFKGLEIYVHLFDPEVHVGFPGEVFDTSLCEALKSRVLVRTQSQSQGAVIMYATKDDADKHHRPLIGAYNWRSACKVIGGGAATHPKTATAIAGTTVNSPSFGDVYVRGLKDGDPEIEGKQVTAFFPQVEAIDGLFDRIPPDAIWNGKDKPEPEPESETSRPRRVRKRGRSD